MARLSLNNFLEVLQRSGLVEQQQLDNALAGLKQQHGDPLPDDTDLVVDHLIDRSYRKANRAQGEIGQRSGRLVRESILFVGGTLLLAIGFAWILAGFAWWVVDVLA